MIDQKSPNYLLPLPHPNNLLQEDVLRLRASLNNLDGLLHYLFEASEQIEVPANAQLTYTPTGLVASMTEVLRNNQTRTTTFTYDDEDKIISSTMVCGATKRQTDYAYSPSGLIASWSTAETLV